MQKIALLFLLALFSLSTANADGIEIKGIINAVDNNAKTITVNNTLLQVMPQTKIELDGCGIFGTDKVGKFVDLSVGSFVEIDAFPNQNGAPLIASDIELKCVSNRAY